MQMQHTASDQTLPGNGGIYVWILLSALLGKNSSYVRAPSPSIPFSPHVHMQGYKQYKGFIIAQAPMKFTCRDFWKMIYERECGVVVMLSDLVENGRVGYSY